MPNIIAECGCSHQGSIDIAKRMISVASNYCKVDAVKFQKRTVESMPESQLNRPYLGAHSFGKTYGEHRTALEFSINQHKELQKWCIVNNVEYACSVWDVEAARQISFLNPAYIKIPSAANLDFKMIKWLLNNYSGKLHISMGMTTLNEKMKIQRLISMSPQKFVVYHCISAYPVSFDDIFLKDIEMYKGWGAGIGYSGHHRGIAVDMAAIARGVEYVERHFTLDRTWKGTDHAASVEPDGLRRLTRDALAVDRAMKESNGGLKEVEIPARKKLRR